MTVQASFALFDFDKTLCRGDSVLPYLLYCIRKGHAPKGQIFRAAAGYVKQRIKPSLVTVAKMEALSFITGKTEKEMDDIARGFFREVQQKKFFKDGLEELKRLRKEGKKILVVSASASVYMRVLPEFLPVDAVLSTVCAVDEDGRYNGLIGENCKGLQKPLRIAEYLAANHMTLDYATSCAYGDSASDAPMLSLTAQPVMVNPAKGLKAVLPEAKEVSWK